MHNNKKKCEGDNLDKKCSSIIAVSSMAESPITYCTCVTRHSSLGYSVFLGSEKSLMKLVVIFSTMTERVDSSGCIELFCDILENLAPSSLAPCSTNLAS